MNKILSLLLFSLGFSNFANATNTNATENTFPHFRFFARAYTEATPYPVANLYADLIIFKNLEESHNDLLAKVEWSLANQEVWYNDQDAFWTFTASLTHESMYYHEAKKIRPMGTINSPRPLVRFQILTRQEDSAPQIELPVKGDPRYYYKSSLQTLKPSQDPYGDDYEELTLEIACFDLQNFEACP